MAPKRSNKGKEKMDYNAKVVFKTPEMRSTGQRVALSKQIGVHVRRVAGGTEDNFESLFKVSRKTFNYIRSLVKDDMIHEYTYFALSGDRHEYTYFAFSDGSLMTLNDQIAIALRRLSSVDLSINIAILFETNDMTVDKVTWQFVEALEARGVHHISWPEDITQTKLRFESIGGMPNCCGAIETTHYKMHPHRSEGETDVWLDSMKNNSMKLQVIVDPTMRFLDAVSGLPGSLTKDNVLQESAFFKLAQNGEKLNGKKVELPEGTKVREYLVGDSGFQLLPWLITPYRDGELTEDQAEFNKRHSATRLVAGCALKKLKEVWAVIEGGMWLPDRHKLPRIIFACCILHNIQIDMKKDEVSDQFVNSFDHDPGYPLEKSALPEDKDAAVVRDKLCLYLAGKLSV